MLGIIRLVTGIFSSGLAGEIRDAYQDRLRAETTQAKLDADERIAVLQNARQIAAIEAADRWSATRLGRLLIVVPFGVWWAAIFIDSTFSMPWDVLALPPEIDAMARVLIPAIVIADAGALTLRAMRK